MENETVDRSASFWNLLAIAISLVGTAGSLWLSLGMGLKACPLCLYQRAFMMASASVLIVGSTTGLRSSWVLSLLALPAVAGGLGVAGFHEFLEQTKRLECPSGILGMGTAPQQSLATFVSLLVVLVIPVLTREGAGLARTSAAGAIGLLLAVGTIRSAPPMPAAPSKPYEQPLDVCRPPYQTPEIDPTNA